MIRGRWVVIALVALVLFSMGREAIDLATPPSYRDARTNSYSGRLNGHRALYEVLESLGHRPARVEDHFARATMDSRPSAMRVLMVEPSLYLMDRENDLIAQAADWVQAGGQLVVVATELDLLEGVRRRSRFEPGERRRGYEQAERIFGEKGLIKGVGLEDLRVRSEDSDRSSIPWHERDVVRIDRVQFERAEEPYTLEGEGTLAAAVEGLLEVFLPKSQPRGLTGDDIERAEGKIEAIDEDGERIVIAVDFAVGDGRVLVCSEPALFNNFGFTKGDNAPLAVRLAVGDANRDLLFDEYHHGAMPIGRPLAIFGIFPYGLIALSLLAATAVAVWYAGIRFGPPLPDPPPSRRSIIEYVDAMARMFGRSGQHRFVLHACMEGVLDEVRAELFLPHGTPTERMLHALERRSPGRAKRLREALNETTQWLRGDARLTRQTLAELQGRLEACRTPRALSPQLRIASARSTAVR